MFPRFAGPAFCFPPAGCRLSHTNLSWHTRAAHAHARARSRERQRRHAQSSPRKRPEEGRHGCAGSTGGGAAGARTQPNWACCALKGMRRRAMTKGLSLHRLPRMAPTTRRRARRRRPWMRRLGGRPRASRRPCCGPNMGALCRGERRGRRRGPCCVPALSFDLYSLLHGSASVRPARWRLGFFALSLRVPSAAEPSHAAASGTTILRLC